MNVVIVVLLLIAVVVEVSIFDNKVGRLVAVFVLVIIVLVVEVCIIDVDIVLVVAVGVCIIVLVLLLVVLAVASVKVVVVRGHSQLLIGSLLIVDVLTTEVVMEGVGELVVEYTVAKTLDDIKGDKSIAQSDFIAVARCFILETSRVTNHNFIHYSCNACCDMN